MQALHDGVCRPLVFPLQGGYAEWVSADGRVVSASFDTVFRSCALQSERLRTALTQEDWLGEVIAKAHGKLCATHPEAGGLAVAMNQDHARFIADLMGAFARSRDRWIVAVRMISEGVDIPRLRVGIFASNVNTEMHFRQFCGRFVRTQRVGGKHHASVYLPDDARTRELASRVTLDVRAYLKPRANSTNWPPRCADRCRCWCRFGGPIASATNESLQRRRRLVLAWLERDRYDGLR